MCLGRFYVPMCLAVAAERKCRVHDIALGRRIEALRDISTFTQLSAEIA